jgi:hypothetical protein
VPFLNQSNDGLHGTTSPSRLFVAILFVTPAPTTTAFPLHCILLDGPTFH